MREIKFRAWDTKAKQMHYEPKEDGFLDGIHPTFVLHYRLFPPHDARFELMQFTGLKDKNGKEIYEGDVVNYDRESFANGLTGLVEWSGSGFYIAKHIQLVTLVEKFNSDIEIIGNIHENPELLTGRETPRG